MQITRCHRLPSKDLPSLSKQPAMSHGKYQVIFTQDQYADMGFDTSRMSSLRLLKNRGLQIVNTRRHLRIMGARRVTWGKFHSEDTVTSGATVQNLVPSGRAAGMATRYGLDGPGIESWWGARHRTRPSRPWGPPSLLYNGHRVNPRE